MVSGWRWLWMTGCQYAKAVCSSATLTPATSIGAPWWRRPMPSQLPLPSICFWVVFTHSFSVCVCVCVSPKWFDKNTVSHFIVCRLIGSYGSLKGGNISEGMEDFTGGIAYSLQVSSRTPRVLWRSLTAALSRGSLLSCFIEVCTHLQGFTPHSWMLLQIHLSSSLCLHRPPTTLRLVKWQITDLLRATLMPSPTPTRPVWHRVMTVQHWAAVIVYCCINMLYCICFSFFFRCSVLCSCSLFLQWSFSPQRPFMSSHLMLS